jgi:hypothetical protein
VQHALLLLILPNLHVQHALLLLVFSILDAAACSFAAHIAYSAAAALFVRSSAAVAPTAYHVLPIAPLAVFV